MTTTPDNLRAELAYYTGTERWRRSINPRVVYSDGVEYFADRVGAYWLIDILATELPRHVAKHGIVFVTLSVSGYRAKLSAVRDAGEKPLWTRQLPFTDAPEGDWSFWVAAGGPLGTAVIYLPSEH